MPVEQQGGGGRCRRFRCALSFVCSSTASHLRAPLLKTMGRRTGWTPLMEVAWGNHVRPVFMMLERAEKASVNQQDKARSPPPPPPSPSHTHTETCHRRPGCGLCGGLAFPLTVGRYRQDGWTALHAAAFKGHEDCILALLDAGGCAAALRLCCY